MTDFWKQIFALLEPGHNVVVGKPTKCHYCNREAKRIKNFTYKAGTLKVYVCSKHESYVDRELLSTPGVMQINKN